MRHIARLSDAPGSGDIGRLGAKKYRHGAIFSLLFPRNFLFKKVLSLRETSKPMGVNRKFYKVGEKSGAR
jgi:hypothetical protein